jgi:hypothetical protein
MPLRIEGLIWDDENEEHIERRLATWEVEELLEGGDYAEFRNTNNHPPNHWRIIGRTPDGLFVTLILEEPRDADPRHWRPITAWRSSETERRMFGQRKKQGRKHG